MPLDPADLNAQIASSFIQDEIAIPPDRRYLTVGTKLEHDDYTGFVLLPSARVTQQPNARPMFGAPISRATRTPHSLDTRSFKLWRISSSRRYPSLDRTGR
jgi:iron complex outermembrane receptor protein